MSKCRFPRNFRDQSFLFLTFVSLCVTMATRKPRSRESPANKHALFRVVSPGYRWELSSSWACPCFIRIWPACHFLRHIVATISSDQFLQSFPRSFPFLRSFFDLWHRKKTVFDPEKYYLIIYCTEIVLHVSQMSKSIIQWHVKRTTFSRCQGVNVTSE